MELYILGLNSNLDIFITQKVLNKYRIHGNQTIALTKSQWEEVNKRMLGAVSLFYDFLKGTRFEMYGESSKFYWLTKYKISENRLSITFKDVFSSYRYFLLTGLPSFISLNITLIALKFFKISVIDMKYK